MNIGKIMRVIWLTETLENDGPLTLSEINRRWEISSYNTEKEGPMTKRSFLRVRHSAEELFDIDIECERSNNCYYLSGSSLEKRQWIIDSIALKSMVTSRNSLADRIILESIPSGDKFLMQIIDAMSSNMVIHMVHQKFGSDSPHEQDVEPYCLRASERRWYMVAHAHNDKNGELKTYGLDRIIDLQITDMTFRMPSKFSASRHFKYAYGAFVYDKHDAVQVKIRTTPTVARFLRTLPLHQSQREVRRSNDFVEFQFHIVPTLDFRQALMRWGSELMVITPQSLRDEMLKETRKMMKMYE